MNKQVDIYKFENLDFRNLNPYNNSKKIYSISLSDFRLKLLENYSYISEISPNQIHSKKKKKKEKITRLLIIISSKDHQHNLLILFDL